jgi:hypothetical protein
MDPLSPFWIELSVGLLFLGLEHTQNVPIFVFGKVRTGAALGDALWEDSSPDPISHPFKAPQIFYGFPGFFLFPFLE